MWGVVRGAAGLVEKMGRRMWVIGIVVMRTVMIVLWTGVVRWVFMGWGLWTY